MPFHVLARRLFGLLFVHAGLAGGGEQRLIVVAHFGADHHLELPGVGKAALHHRQFFDGFRIGFGRIVQHKTQARDAMADGGDVFASANQLDKFIDVLLFYFFAHDRAFKQR